MPKTMCLSSVLCWLSPGSGRGMVWFRVSMSEEEVLNRRREVEKGCSSGQGWEVETSLRA